MNDSDFRRIALGLKDAVESAHMGHPDFRANGRIFATLHDDRAWGMVKLTPDQQQAFMRDQPAAFTPEAGAWGLQGCTAVRLGLVNEDSLGEALTMAWRNAVERASGRAARKGSATLRARKTRGHSRSR
jgi:YjbR protein